MLEHAVYSVISPEGCASILWRDKAKAAEAADALKLTATSAREFGIVDEILPEPLGGAHRNPTIAANTVKNALISHLATLSALSGSEIADKRYARLRALGKWKEASADED